MHAYSSEKMHMHPCMRAYTMVQKLLCHGSYCELILSLARISCRLSFAARPAAVSTKSVARAVRSRNPSKSTLAHDAVAAAVLHKHHLIIRVGAGLIQVVYGSRSHLANGGCPSQKCVFAIFARVRVCVCRCVCVCVCVC